MISRLLAMAATGMVIAAGAIAAESPSATAERTERFLANVGEAHLASQLIGETVYGSAAENAETIGEVNDLVVDDGGEIDAAVVGVGGFLGVGEKNVAVSFDSLKRTVDKDGDAYLVLETTKEELENAPAFEMQIAAPTRDPTAKNYATGEAPQTPNAVPPVAPATQAAPERDTLKMVDVKSISSDDVIGATVYSADNESVGEIGEVVMTGDGKIDAIVIDVGGFLGIGTKPVAIAFEDLEFRADENRNFYVYTTFTDEQLKAAADYVKDTYPQNRDAMLLRSKG